MNQFKLITEQKKSGNSYYIAYYTINGKQKKFSSGVQYTGKRKDENLAFSIISSKIADAEKRSKKTIIGDDSQLFVDFMAEYIETRLYKTENTKLSYQKLFKARIEPYFTQHKIALKELTKFDIQTFCNHLYNSNSSRNKDKKLSPKYVKDIHGLIAAALEEAKDRNLCDNVASGVKLIQPTEYKGVQIYTENELKAMLEASTIADNASLIMQLLCRTGVRNGELRLLQWKYFDSDTQTLRIVVSKTEAGERTLSLGDKLCQTLINEREKQKQYKKLFAETYIDNDYIVKAINGRPYSERQITRRVHKIMSALNLPIGRVHDLRHSVTVNLLDKNKNLFTVSKYLGHKDLNSTKRYMHFSAEQNRDVANALDY